MPNQEPTTKEMQEVIEELRSKLEHLEYRFNELEKDLADPNRCKCGCN